MSARSPWLLTWLQPVAALVVLVIGLVANPDYPAGEPAEHGLLAALVLVTLPGLVVAVADAVEKARTARPGERPHYQQMMDRAVPRGATPVLPSSVAADVMARLIMWGLLQAVLSLVTGLVLMPLPVDEDWTTLPMVVGAVALAVVLLVLLAGIGWLAVTVLRAGLRGGADEPLVDVPQASAEARAHPPLVFRAMLVMLGVCLLGLATFWLPSAVLSLAGDLDVPPIAGVLGLEASTVEAAGMHGAWLWALRVTSMMVLGGLAAVIVLSPVSLWMMVIRPR